MRYTKALEFPQGLTIHQAKTLHPGQYIRLFNSTKLSRWVGVSRTGTMIALHTNRSGKLVQYFRHSIKHGG